MTDDKFVEIAVGALTVFSAVNGAVIAWLIRQERRMGRLEFRMETVWDGWFKNAMTHAVNKGFGQMNSPMVATERGRRLIEPLLADLQEWHKGKELWDHVRLGEALHRDWFDRLAKEIAIPNHEPADVCMALAFSILRPPQGQIGTKKASDTDPDIKPPA